MKTEPGPGALDPIGPLGLKINKYRLPSDPGPVLCNTRMPRDICADEGCKIYASFNWPLKLNPKYCNTHRAPGMVNAVNRVCQLGTKCKNRPEYALVSHPSVRISCKQHKAHEMILVDRKPRATKKPRISGDPPDEDEDFSVPSVEAVTNKAGNLTYALALQ